MNILMLAWEYPPNLVGGLGAHVAHLAPELVERGIHVHVVTPRLKGGEPEESLGLLQVSRVDGETHSEDFVENVLAINDYLYGRAAAVVGTQPGPWLLHGHDWLIRDAASRLRADYGLRFLATIHATEYGRNQGIHTELQARVHEQELALAKEADALIACSQFMANQIQEVFQVPAEKLHVIPNGVDVTRLGSEPFDRQAFRREYASEDERLVLYVGRLVAEKGIYVLLDAVPKVLDVDPKVTFVVVGSGPSLRDAESKASQAEWAKRIQFTGFVSEEVRNRLYLAADVAVFPSLYEPFGIVALEAMALGVPVVASNAGGLVEVVEPEETGVVVEAGSSDSLAWGIAHVLAQPTLSASRATRARDKAATDFNWRVVADATVRAYEALLAG